MPHIKMARKSTDTDMTPFVDIAFLILSFFIMATKFKPPEPVEITTPNSVSSDILKEENAMLITIDKEGKVYVNVSSPKDQAKVQTVAEQVNSLRTLNLTPAEIQNFGKTEIIGVPFANLKQYLAMSQDQQKAVKLPGIPVTDSLNNELVWWVSATKKAFAGSKLLYLIKGDNNSKFPTFNSVIDALRRNDEFKYNLITSQEGAPEGTDLYFLRQGR
jgi:biopolymer transport protein ExbD